MTDRGALVGCVAALAFGAALVAVGCQHPQPTPATPAVDAGPPFACGQTKDSVPAFEQLANDLVYAAQASDDAEALAAIDAIALRAGRPQAVCAIGFILPDLRSAPVTGLHLEMWRDREQAGADASASCLTPVMIEVCEPSGSRGRVVFPRSDRESWDDESAMLPWCDREWSCVTMSIGGDRG